MKMSENCVQNIMYKHVQMWGKMEGESCWNLNQECSSS